MSISIAEHPEDGMRARRQSFRDLHARRSCLAVAICALTALAVLVPASAGADPPQPGPLDVTGEIDGAPFRIVVPANWKGKLLVYARGYRDRADHPGEVDARSVVIAPCPTCAAPLLVEGWALAGSAYKSNGWAVKDALDDLVALTSHFRDTIAKPERLLLVGNSMGSLPTLRLAERNGGAFDGYIAKCSIGAGAPRAFDTTFADLQLAYDVTFGIPAAWGTVGDVRDDLDFESEVLPVLLGQLSDPLNLGKFEFIRLVTGTPGSGLTPPPGLYPEALFEPFFFATEGAAEAERRAGGPIMQNLDHSYALSAAEKAELASLGLDADALLQAMNARRNISAPPASRNYLEHYADYSGEIKKPVLTLHTVIDEIVPVAHESAYRETVAAAGKNDLLVQAYSGGIGHCNLSEAQVVAAVHALDAWIATGVAPTDASFPAALGFVPGFTPPPWPQP
jgi:pimeloyl-ACP methyl ester carboxylesterase